MAGVAGALEVLAGEAVVVADSAALVVAVQAEAVQAAVGKQRGCKWFLNKLFLNIKSRNS